MKNALSNTLVLAVTAKTGSRLAAKLAGVPAEYGEMLRMLTETIASGRGSRPNDYVEKVTGPAPTKFADFARRTALAWR
jgi:hypothetical protein